MNLFSYAIQAEAQQDKNKHSKIDEFGLNTTDP
jgi:hypothetical protein